MSIDSGRASLRRFFLRGSIPSSSDAFWLEALKKNRFKEKKLKAEEENSGWAISGNELLTNFKIDNTAVGKYLIFSLRRDSLKVPRSLLNIHMRARILEKTNELGVEQISKQQKNELKEELLNQLEAEIPATIQIAQILVDPVKKQLVLSSTSSSLSELFLNLFTQSFGFKILQANFMSVAERLLSRDEFDRVLDEPRGAIVDSAGPLQPEFEDGPEARLGASFLTWLLYRFQTEQGTFQIDSIDTALYCDEYLLLEGEVEGSRQTLVNRGTASRCPELIRALQVGKLVSKLRAILARSGDQEEDMWHFGVDKKNYDLVSLKVPKVSEADFHSRNLQRFAYLYQAFDMLDALFAEYLELRYSSSWSKTKRGMAEWIG